VSTVTDNPLGLSLPAPEVSAEEVARFVAILKKAGARQTAAEISALMYGTVTESLKRKIRAIASAARPRVVSFPGSNGYTLLERCTLEEIRHGIAALESQGKSMIKDANIYRVAYHRFERGVKPEEMTLELFA
jgi:hypothetical protein